MLKEVAQITPPNIIFASPPCETWVSVSIGNVRRFDRNFNEYNLYWQKNWKPNNYMEKHRELRILGQKTAYWTMRIIKEFSPEMWCIENGASSLIFKYLYQFHGLQGVKNQLTYNAYDKDFPMKPTVIYSNKLLQLKSINSSTGSLLTISKKQIDKIRHLDVWKDFGSPTAYLRSKYKMVDTYADRSKVPIQLYKHILEIYEGKHQVTFF